MSGLSVVAVALLSHLFVCQELVMSVREEVPRRQIWYGIFWAEPACNLRAPSAPSAWRSSSRQQLTSPHLDCILCFLRRCKPTFISLLFKLWMFRSSSMNFHSSVWPVSSSSDAGPCSPGLTLTIFISFAYFTCLCIFLYSAWGLEYGIALFRISL